ncbi:MAG: GLPGLI family protein [Janthinobacterium lividum]
MKYTLLSILFFAIAFSCEAQTSDQTKDYINLRCSYIFKFKIDSLSDATRVDNQLLEISPKLSRYTSKGQLLADSLLTVFSSMPFNQASADFYTQQRSRLPANRTSFMIYKFKPSGLIRFYDKIAINGFFYEENSTIFNWKILGEKSVIAGYNCQMATTVFAGRVWEVWFTRDIPVSDGPYKFSGLPGLIIKASDSKSNFIFELASLSKPKENKALDLPQSSKYTKTTRQDFRKGREAERSNGLSQMVNSGEITFNKDKAQSIRNSQSVKPFNPIEIK